MVKQNRKFTILDLMICVAFVGLGAALFRLMSPYLRGWSPFARSAKFEDHLVDLSGVAKLASEGLFCANLCVLTLRFIPPRPSVRKLARQLGFVACFVAAIAVLAPLVRLFAQLVEYKLLGLKIADPSHYLTPIVDAAEMAGAGVMASWGILVLRRGARMKADWVEYMARTLGVVWIVQWILWHGLYFAGVL